MTENREPIIRSGPQIVDAFGPFETFGVIQTDGGRWYSAWGDSATRYSVGPYRKASYAQAHARYAAACAYVDLCRRSPLSVPGLTAEGAQLFGVENRPLTRRSS